MKLKVKRLSSDAVLPAYSHDGDVGMDLCANETVDIPQGASRLIQTGIAIELPAGYEAQIRPRSGLALNYSITVLNSPGTIDTGYRGEIGVILINHGQLSYQVEKGSRIAQLVVKPILMVVLEETRVFSETIRGSGGFGSTGN